MRTFEFKPSYYEWHLTDKATGKILLNIVDPSDYLYDPLTGEPLSRKEIENMAHYWLKEAELCNAEGEPFNGVLVASEPLDEKEKENAATLIADTLCEYYLS